MEVECYGECDADHCEEMDVCPHGGPASDFSYDIQGIYSRLTGDHTDWYRCTTEPWWSLGALLHATAV